MMPNAMYLLYFPLRLCKSIQTNLRLSVSTGLTWSNSRFFNFANTDTLD